MLFVRMLRSFGPSHQFFFISFLIFTKWILRYYLLLHILCFSLLPPLVPSTFFGMLGILFEPAVWIGVFLRELNVRTFGRHYHVVY